MTWLKSIRKIQISLMKEATLWLYILIITFGVKSLITITLI